MRTRLSAGLIPVQLTRRGPRYLLLRAYSYWDFPKGLVERGESPLSAACRELKEETGLTAIRFSWGKGFVETPPYNQGKIARYYLAEVLDARPEVILLVNPGLGFAEHHEHRWVSAREARQLLAPRVLAVLEWAEERLAHERLRAPAPL